MNMIDAPPKASWDRRNGVIRELGLPILFGAVVLFFSATMLLSVNITAMRSNADWIQNTQQILLAVGDAEAGVVGEQLTVRSYALTGDRRFLRFQDNERSKLVKAMNRLATLAATEPGGKTLVEQIRRRVDEHMALWEGLKGIGPDRASVVARAIVDPKNRLIMLGTRKALADYRAAEVLALGERQSRLARQLSQSFVLALGIIAAAFVLGGVGLVAGQFRIPLRR
jgi:CHASE3 domain sensor protein